MAKSSPSMAKLWKRKNNKYEYIQTLRGHQDQVWSVKFSPDDSFIATGSQDKTIKIYLQSKYAEDKARNVTFDDEYLKEFKALNRNEEIYMNQVIK